MKKFYLLPIIIIVLLSFGFWMGHNDSEKMDLKDRTVSDTAVMKNFPVTVSTFNSEQKRFDETFERPPHRVIAVWQSSIETLLALGQGDRIIAAVGLPDEKYLKEEYREEYRKIPYRNFNVFKCATALSMNPDFIITCWGSAFRDKNLGSTFFWNDRGVKTYIGEMPRYVVKYRTIDEEYRFIRDLGKIFGVPEKAENLVEDIQKEINYVTDKVDYNKADKKKVMVMQFMGKKIKNWGENSLQGDIVAKLNGKLVMPEENFISKEDILEVDPEVLFVMMTEWEYDNPEERKNKIILDPSLSSLKSVKNGRVYVLPLYAVNYGATRLGEGINMVARGMYPELYDN